MAETETRDEGDVPAGATDGSVESDPVPVPVPVPVPESVSGSESVSESESESVSVSESESVSGSGSESVTDTESESATATESATDTDTESATDTDTESATDTDTESATTESATDPASAITSPGTEKRKRKRRRRKKKSAAGDVAAAEGAEGPPPREDHERRSTAPFIKWFEGHAMKRHAFSVGEIVAGRVVRVDESIIAVDLFGKADAVCDIREPREIEMPPEPPPPPMAPSSAGHLAAQPDAAHAAAEPAPTDDIDPLGDTGELEPVELPADAELGAVHDAEPDAAEATSDHDGAADDDETLAPEVPEVPPPPPPNIGEIFRGRIGAVAESGHVGIVNRVIDRAAARVRIENAREEKRRVEGLVFGFNRGGFDVLVEGIRVFCPVSGMALEHIDDPHPYLGMKLEFTVAPKKSGGGQGPVITRRSILEREQRKARKARLKTLEPGEVVRGRVTQVREFGVFVDIGEGLEGLVHQSELGWARNIRPADVAKPGDELEVKILKVGKDKQGRVGLSLRELMPDPWDQHADVLKEGSARKGKVVSTTDFGAFIELVPGIEGLLHISELGRDLKHASQAVKEGDELDVVVERADRGQRRISLSKLSPGEAQAIAEGKLDLAERPRSLKPGTHVVVVIEKVEHHGVQVQVKGVLGRRGRGYLPNRELGSAESGERKAKLGVGSELNVKIVGADRDGGLRVSVKGREQDEERSAVRDYRKESAKQGFGTFGDLLRSKLGNATEDG